MTMQAIEIYAGSDARQVIKQRGFSADLFDFMLGASGGPKWFVLAGLDKYLLAEFFANRQRPLDLLGSSAGAFRFGCYAQRQPVEALQRLIDSYSHITYSEQAGRQEISSKSEQLVSDMLGQNGAQEIVDNPVFRAHFVTARCLGWSASRHRAIQLCGLLVSALANKLSRRYLDHFYQRVILGAGQSQLQIDDSYQLDTLMCKLSRDNVVDGLLASGAIPMIINGIENIAGAPPGMYRDGGVVDYHFDLAMSRPDSQQGLCLYPHFSPVVRAGWFDKNSHRKVRTEHFRKVVMIVPSQKFVSSLPLGKIPDRKDFEQLSDAQRIPYWQAVIKQSEQLAEEFSQWLNQPDCHATIRPIDALLQH